MGHLEPETIRRFANATASRDENRAVVRHLLKRCPQCARELSTVLLPPVVHPSEYDRALERWQPLLGDTLLLFQRKSRGTILGAENCPRESLR